MHLSSFPSLWIVNALSTFPYSSISIASSFWNVGGGNFNEGGNGLHNVSILDEGAVCDHERE